MYNIQYYIFIYNQIGSVSNVNDAPGEILIEKKKKK